MYRGYAVENEETGASYAPKLSENGLEEFTVDQATSGTVKIYYKGTVIQHVSVWISFVTVVMLVILGIWQKISEKTEKRKW